MSRSQPTNVSASVPQRLLTVSKSLQEDFTLTLTRYAIERFLYRLSRSPFADRFVLKGAILLNVWAKQPFRRTRDLDLLGYGEPSAAHLREVFAELCALQVEPDGLIFDPTTIRIEAIRDDQEYQGERLRVILSANAAMVLFYWDIGRTIPALQIDNQAHRRTGKAVTNFPRTLPPGDSDMAAQAFEEIGRASGRYWQVQGARLSLAHSILGRQEVRRCLQT